MAEIANSENIIKIGDFKYQLNMFLFNDKNQFIALNRNAIRQLTITDNIFNPFHEATLLMVNDYQIFERTNLNYTFLGNGRDIIYIDLMPTLTGDDSEFDDEQKRKMFSLHFAFVVIKCEDVMFQNSLCLKLELVEYEQYLLNENNFTVSSASLTTTDINKTNNERSAYTGDLIKALLTNALTTENRKKPIINEQNFDRGSTQEFYTPLVACSSVDVINAMLELHSSQENNDWCVLNCDRYTKTFSLQSLADIFKKNSQLVIESIKLKQLVADETSSDGGTQLGSIKWQPTALTFDDLSHISEYFTDHSNANFIIDLQTNKITNSDIKPDKAFMMNVRQGFSEEVLKAFSELYIKPFGSLFASKKLVPIVQLTNLQKSGTALASETRHTPSAISSSTTAIQKYNAMLFMDRVHIFNLPGISCRQAGFFIDVTTETDELKTLWDYRTLGRHFITLVQHVFTQDTYQNRIETIKPYAVDAGQPK